MARRDVVQKSSLDLDNPAYLALSDAVDAFQSAEQSFYQSRVDELNGYPGLGGLELEEVEKKYDEFLGEQPWQYLTQFTNSGNSAAVETSNAVDFAGNDIDRKYVRITTALSSLSDISDIADPPNFYVLYNPGAGNIGIDLLYTDISFFGVGSIATAVVDQADDGDIEITYHTGFGEVPIGFQSNSSLSGLQAHMYRLIGSGYNSAIGNKYSTYLSALNTYQNTTGTSLTPDFFSGVADQPWKDFQGDINAGYNRPGKLNAQLVRETRGAN